MLAFFVDLIKQSSSEISSNLRDRSLFMKEGGGEKIIIKDEIH